MSNVVQFQIQGQNLIAKTLSRVPMVGESLFLISHNQTNLQESIYKQFIVRSVSTVIKDPSPPKGYIGMTDDHYICAIEPVIPKQKETKPQTNDSSGEHF